MITDDRLREIANREYGPNRQEWEAMAKELLAHRRMRADDPATASGPVRVLKLERLAGPCGDLWIAIEWEPVVEEPADGCHE